MFKLEEIPIKVILLPTLYCQTISQQSKLKFVKTLVCQNFSVSKRALRENWEGCHDEPDLQFFLFTWLRPYFDSRLSIEKQNLLLANFGLVIMMMMMVMIFEKMMMASTSLATLFHVSHSWSAKEICECHWGQWGQSFCFVCQSLNPTHHVLSDEISPVESFLTGAPPEPSLHQGWTRSTV